MLKNIKNFINKEKKFMAKYYEEINQGRCPKCGKKVEICENDVTIDSNNLYYYFSCDCGFVGH